MGGVYRYGFNGKENDNEIKGEGNQQDYGMRIYDPRVGRFLSVDPLTPKYPMLTPYQFASNRPIDGIDVDGLEYGSSFDAKSSLYIGNLFLSGDKKLNRDELEARGNAYNNGLRTGYTVGALISVDLYTGGRLSQLTLAGGIFWHKAAPTAEGRAAQVESSRDAVMALGVGYVGGKIIGGSIRLGKNLMGFSKDAVEDAKYLFRGSSEGFEGSPGAQRTASTPTSTDPGVATMFAVKAKRYGNGILQIALPKDLQDVSVGVTTNVLKHMEGEVVVDLKPVEFSKRASITITADQARGILKNMGINIPARIDEGDMGVLLKNIPKLTNEQTNNF